MREVLPPKKQKNKKTTPEISIRGMVLVTDKQKTQRRGHIVGGLLVTLSSKLLHCALWNPV